MLKLLPWLEFGFVEKAPPPPPPEAAFERNTGSPEPAAAVSGNLQFKTYRKPAWRPQYICWYSQHAPACKRGIFAGEVRRHLINSSKNVDFQAEINQLRTELTKRGYPGHILPDVRYDAKERQQLLQKIVYLV